MNIWLNRRKFLQYVASLLGASAFSPLAGCSQGANMSPETVKSSEISKQNTETLAAVRKSTTETNLTATPSPVPTTVIPVPTPTPVTLTPSLLRNQNLGQVNIRYSKKIEPVDVESWRLSITGMVDKVKELTLDDLKALPADSQNSRMKCVEGWSFAAKWIGFRPHALLNLVQPQAEAQWARFYCADDYFETLEMQTLLHDRVLFAYAMNDAPLPPMHGAPLRLIVPFMYGYKGPKVIQKIVFAATEVPEDWMPVEKYGLDGTILPGKDHALDLGITRVFNRKGEIVYEQGLESN